MSEKAPKTEQPVQESMDKAGGYKSEAKTIAAITRLNRLAGKLAVDQLLAVGAWGEKASKDVAWVKDTTPNGVDFTAESTELNQEDPLMGDFYSTQFGGDPSPNANVRDDISSQSLSLMHRDRGLKAESSNDVNLERDITHVNEDGESTVEGYSIHSHGSRDSLTAATQTKEGDTTFLDGGDAQDRQAIRDAAAGHFREVRKRRHATADALNNGEATEEARADQDAA